MLRIWFLGVLRLEIDGVETLPPSSRRSRLLLAMLALDRPPHSREALAARLWPGKPDHSARASLRTALTQLRTALRPDPGRFLQATREHVALAGPEQVWTDVGELEQLLELGDVPAALALWGGELLTGLEDEWVHDRRDQLQQRLGDALGTAAAEAEAGGDLETALLWSRHHVLLDPLGEESQRELIRRLALAGERAAALAAYDALSQRLRNQLATVPSKATRDLAAAIRAGATPRGYRSVSLSHDIAPAAVVRDPASGATPVRSALPQPLQFAVASSPRFVGREAEFARLRERWQQVCGGALVTVVVAGEPGIGKTRLAAELAHTLQREGAFVLYGGCDEGLAVPYQPFLQALRPYVRTLGPERLWTQLGSLACELSRMLPELATLGDPVHADPESERFALFEAVAALVAVLSHQRPVLLILDDLHWATAPTLLLVRHLIRSERPRGALIICNYRETEIVPGHPLAQLLADLQRDVSAERMNLGGLSEPAITVLLEAAIGHTLDERALQLVHVLEGQTAGNPFFLRELLTHLADSGERFSASEMAAKLGVSDGMRQVISQRVARLSPPAGRAVRVAAVTGPTFPFVVLERVFGEQAGLLDALDEVVAAGLVTEAGDDNYVFVHALVRETVYAQLGSARRIHLHRQVGEALETLDDVHMHVEALAYHFAQAAADGQGAKAATYALGAGQSAMARLGYEEAAAHYERGLEALTLNEQREDRRRCELLLALGEARWGAGELDNARRACGQAAQLAEELGNGTALAQAALGFCGPYYPEVAASAPEPAAGLLERALAACGDDDSLLRAQLMGRLAAVLAYTDVQHRKPLLARQALEMARRIGHQATLADVLASSLWVTRGPDTPRESVAVTEELARLADDLGDRQLWMQAQGWKLDFLLELGDIEAVERELKAFQQRQDPRERHAQWRITTFHAGSAYLQGRLEDCEARSQEALTYRLEGDDEGAIQIFGVALLLVRREQGRLDELVEAVEAFAAQYRQLGGWPCALAYIYAELQRTEQARQELDTLARADFKDIPRDVAWLPSLSGLCEVAVFLGDADRAQTLYEMLLPYADRCMVTVTLLSWGSVSRLLGLLATTLSRFEDAARHFEQALKMNRQIRSPLWIAHTQHEYARMLLLRDHAGGRDRALQLLGGALITAEDLGLSALRDKAQLLKASAEAG